MIGHSNDFGSGVMPRPIWRRTWFAAAVMVGCIIVAFSPALRAGFIWDDNDHLTENPCIVGPDGLKDVWTTARAVYYPLVLTTYWALHKLAGLNPFPYHLLNLILHSASALLLWYVLRRLEVRAAWLGAFFWALHPVTVESVAWVTELKNTQSCFFYLVSIALFLKAYEQRPGNRLLALSLISFVLAITSKPATVMLPVVLALCVWWEKKALSKRDLILLLPFFLISGTAAVWTVIEQRFHSGAAGLGWDLTTAQRLVVGGRAVWFYLGKVIWPHPLIFIYPRWKIETVLPVDFIPLFAAIGGLLFLWFKRNGVLRPAFFAAAYFVVSLFPVLGFFNVYFFIYSFVSDHFQYLACMAPLALTASAGAVALGRVQRSQILGCALSAAVLLVLGSLTWRQALSYRDIETIYRTTIEKDPHSWMAQFNLGLMLLKRHETEEGIKFLRGAAMEQPDAKTNATAASALRDSGRLDEAISYDEKAIQADPTYLAAHVGLATAYQEKQEPDLAISEYQKALQLKPAPEIHQDLAGLFFEQGRYGEALSHIQETIKAEPKSANAHVILGNILMVQNLADQAITEYSKAIELDPNNADAHYNLGTAYFKTGQTNLGQIELDRASELGSHQ
jgi:tetratricopeptide (TPR) repeat protein